MNNFMETGHKIICELPPLLLKEAMSSCVTRHGGCAKRREILPKGEEGILR